MTRLQRFNRPEFYLTDRDYPPPQQPRYHQQVAAWIARGCIAWVSTKRELENYIHLGLVTGAAPAYSGTGADFDDVPLLFAEAVHTAVAGSIPWAGVPSEKKKHKSSMAKKQLNEILAKQMTPTLLSLSDPADEVRQWLRAIGVALKA